MDMNLKPYEPIYELTRGEIVESIHYGSVVVVDPAGHLLAWYGNPDTVTFLRSSAKPFQALPFIEAGGAEHFGLTLKEIALICASHSGTDEHVATARSIQDKVGIGELDLMCGIHPPTDTATAEMLRQRGEQPTPNQNNCSGKHSGMLAYARLMGWPVAHYIDPIHPVQMHILQTFAEMCGIPMEEVELGIDGCSAPNFAIPLRNAAQGYARLSDPANLPEARASACRLIFRAMTSNPEIVAGPGRFDTALMQVAGDRLVSKGGAEGYQGVGILPGAMGPDSPALGIALKISDGDAPSRARPGVILSVLRQLGVLSESELETLAPFGPEVILFNYNKLTVGNSRPAFELQLDPALGEFAAANHL